MLGADEEESMWRKTPFLFLLVTLISILAIPGCAVITRKSTQRIPVTSSPVGATVSVNGKALGATPLEIMLPSRTKNQVIRIEFPGYNPAEIRPQRKMSAGPVMGDFLLGLIPAIVPAAIYWGRSDAAHSDLTLLIWGLSTTAFGAIFTAIDIGEGRAFELKPTYLAITLTKADGAPRVDTMIVDADDLQNIRWIRIH
jgi:hypothetical protein